MKINGTYEITRNDGITILYKNGKPFGAFEPASLEKLYGKLMIAPAKGQNREEVLNNFFTENSLVEESKNETKEERIEKAISHLLDFFTEFNFTPSFRFLNTLGRLVLEERTPYVCRYFSLMGSPYAEDVAAKTASAEFANIMNGLKDVEPTHIINSRFRIYYGAQGTGKTTKALAETANRCIICNASMLPADLIEDFTFDDGKAAFHPSILVECMENGLPITLDEINLLPFDSLRFLQGIFDGKREFQYKGRTIHINDGFKVIGTMNLSVNGVVFGLPEPLVDRCEMIQEFELTPKMLMGAF